MSDSVTAHLAMTQEILAGHTATAFRCQEGTKGMVQMLRSLELRELS